MTLFVYTFFSALIALIQSLPLRAGAFLGRSGGAVVWALNLKHRKIALKNLAASFPAKPADEIYRIGRENMLRIAENYVAAVKTSSMSLEEVRQVCEVRGLEKLPKFAADGSSNNCIVAIGHFGNFELYALLGQIVPGVRPATTYRGLKDPRLSQLMQKLRGRSGCRFFERRTESAELKEALRKGGLLLGLLADQHVSSGIWGPFMGRPCATSPAPALFALRYRAPLFSAICYRTALGRWRIDIGDEIPTRRDGELRGVAEITADINAAFETAVRRDPANWFWVHNRWKPNSKKTKPEDARAAGLAAEPAPL